MRKRDELEKGCIAKARPDEMTFVLLGRDAMAPEAVRFWCRMRAKAGLNKPDDPQIKEALACARVMEMEREELRQALAGTCPVKPKPLDRRP